MKKELKGFVCGVIAATLVAGGAAFAAGQWKSIDVLENDITVIVDGKQVTENNFVYNDTTYLPLRAVAEAVGKPVDYDEKTNTAYIGSSSQLESMLKPILINTNTGLFSIGKSENLFWIDKTTEKVYLNISSKYNADLLNELYNIAHNNYIPIYKNDNPYLNGYIYAEGIEKDEAEEIKEFFPTLSEEVFNYIYVPSDIPKDQLYNYVNILCNVKFDEKYYNASDTYFDISFPDNTGKTVLLTANPDCLSDGVFNKNLGTAVISLDAFFNYAGIEASYHYDETNKTIVFDYLKMK